MPSASLEASLRLEIAEYQAALAKAQGSLSKFKESAIQTGKVISNSSAGWGKGQSSSLRNLGNVSMQMQDVAVQMQMGTKMSTILAQQGSQVLSVFGPGGAVAGGLVAVGGLLYSMRQASQQALAAIKADADGLDASFRILSAGGIIDMINGMEKMKKTSEALFADINQPPGWLETGIRYFTGESTNDEEQSIKRQAAYKNEEMRDKLMKRLVETSKEELKIVELRASGQIEEAERMERKVAMAKELAQLQDAPEEIRSGLQANARAKYAALEQQAQSKAMDEAFDKTQKITNAQKALDDKKRDAGIEQLTLGQRISVIQDELQNATEEEAALRADFAPDAERIIAAESRKVELQSELVRLQKQSADEAARAAKKAEDEANAKRDSLMSLAAEMKDLELRAAGRDREADVIREAERIEKQAGVDSMTALRIAERMIALKEKGNALDRGERAEGERKKIISRRDGSTLPKQSGRFGSLDDYYRLQQKREVPLDERFANQKARGGGAGLPIGQSSALVPRFNDSLAGRTAASRAAMAQDRGEKSSPKNKTDEQILQVLIKGLLGQ